MRPMQPVQTVRKSTAIEEEMSEKTICNNCVHCYKPFFIKFLGEWQCKASPKEDLVDFVTGKIVKCFEPCCSVNINRGNCSLYEAKK